MLAAFQDVYLSASVEAPIVDAVLCAVKEIAPNATCVWPRAVPRFYFVAPPCFYVVQSYSPVVGLVAVTAVAALEVKETARGKLVSKNL